MGRRRFEIRAFGARSTEQKHFGQLRRWNQTCDCCYDNSCDLFAGDSRGLTKVIEEQCLFSTQGGYSKFQVTGMIEWRQKSKPKKFPGPKVISPKNPMSNFRALKVSTKQNKFGCTLFAEARSWETRTLPRIVRLFWIPKKSLLKSSHPKKIPAKLSYPKKFRNRKFQTPKNSSIIPVTWVVLY